MDLELDLVPELVNALCLNVHNQSFVLLSSDFQVTMLAINENLLQHGISQPQRVTLRGICTQGWILQCRRAQQVLDCLLLWSNRVIDIFAG